MPISPKRQLIFVHIPRTGGSSVEIALGVFRDHEVENRQMMFGLIQSEQLKAQNLSSKYLHHLTAQDIKKLAPSEIFQNYFKFAFVRNPWDKLVSAYHYLPNPKGLTFPEFLQDFLKSDHWFALDQYRFIYDDNNQKMVDFVGRFEKINKDFKKICSIVGVRGACLRHTNKRKRRHYSTYYNDNMANQVALRYKTDIDLFDYRFEKQNRLGRLVEDTKQLFQDTVNRITRFTREKKEPQNPIAENPVRNYKSIKSWR